jgi:hypothetical protein
MSREWKTVQAKENDKREVVLQKKKRKTQDEMAKRC